MRRSVALLVLMAPVVLSGAAGAEPPVPEANFATTIVPSACTATPGNAYEAAQYAREGWDAAGRYPGRCQRLRFVFGPIHVKPGQNDVLIEPVTIQKPAYDGYITRFRPDLVRVDGSVPPIEQLHLHHATWLQLTGYTGGGGQVGPIDMRPYAAGPFFAAGEEKTIANIPVGYGLPVLGTDQWQLLYMIHNQTPTPDEVFITYDIDYVAKADGAALGLKPAYPVWLDVRPSTYPVFNVQRKYADASGNCTWPANQCADFDPWGNVVTGQGAPGNGLGTAFTIRGRLGRLDMSEGGTVIGIGGHVHPGGRSVSVDLVRGSSTQRIFTSEAVYWDGQPTSWDMSMTVTGYQRWAVDVQPDDRLVINATYDATIASTYENMGISVAYISPRDTVGLDPFAAPKDDVAIEPGDCLQAPTPTLCTKGSVTHGHLPEADNKGGAGGSITAMRQTQESTTVHMAGFVYVPGDLGTVESTGIPTVKVGTPLRFVNEDAAANVYHSATSCAYPCLGATGIAFPLADGQTSIGRAVDFDSGELGFGPPDPAKVGPAKNEITWDLPTDGLVADELVTYFCRVHPSMRGVFAAVD